MVPPNKLKQLLAQGKVAFGATIQIPATALVEIVGRVGFDFTMIDTEHGMYDMQTAGELLRVAQGVGLTPLVRVLKNEKELIMKALDLGAEGVIVPHVSTPEHAEQAVRACRYGVDGWRGACPLVRAAGYSLSEWRGYEAAANENAMVVLIVEDPEGVANIEEIVSVEGVAAVFLGLFDLTVSLGCGGNSEDPRVQQSADKILAACHQKGVPAMYSVTSGPDVDSWVRRGVRMVLAGADTRIFSQACKAFLNSVAHLRCRGGA